VALFILTAYVLQNAMLREKKPGLFILFLKDLGVGDIKI
jgi:hypothetical protein